MPDELKQLLKAGCLAVWIGSTLMGVLWFFSLQKQFNDRVAEDVRDVGRSIAIRNELGREASEYLEAGDLDGYRMVMEQGKARIEEQTRQQYEARKRRYPGLDWDEIERRNGVPGVPEAAAAVPITNRVDGAYYPDEQLPVDSAPSEDSTWMALGVAGTGGFVIFLGTGLVARRILGATTEPEADGSETADPGEESYVVIGADEGLHSEAEAYEDVTPHAS